MSTEPKRVGLRHARLNLTQIVMRARYKQETFLIAKHGEPLALVIPFGAIPTLQPPVYGLALDEPLTEAQKKWGALAKMIPADTKR